MAVEDLGDDTFADRIAAAKVAVVDFHAGWCGPCLMFKPKFKRISADYPDVAFFMVDGEKAPGAREKIGLAAWRAWRAGQKRHEPAGPPPAPRPATVPVHAARARPIDMVLGGLIAGALELVRGRSRNRS